MASTEPEPEADPLAGLAAKRDNRRARGRAFDREQLFDSLQTAQKERPKALANGVGMRFVLLPEGTFEMGAPPDEPGRRTNEGPAHEVVLTQAFYLAVHPVTQAEYQAVMGTNPSRFKAGDGGGPDYPVENVSWDDAVRFCKALSNRPDELRAKRTFRLPTEAEWEYACRAGTTTPFSHGAAFTADQGRFDSPRQEDGHRSAVAVAPGPSAVGTYPANLFGLCDMHGNVWEWCADWYGEGYYRETSLRDPVGPTAGRFRVLRGGSWRNGADRCRAAYRNALAAHQKDSATGFRVVLVMGE